MKRAGKVLLIVYLLAIHLLVGFLIYERFFVRRNPITLQIEETENPVASLPETIPPVSYERPQVLPTPVTTPPSDGNVEMVAVQKLMIPVVGVKRADLRDTFNDSRSEGRTHNAIDIMAAQGTPVVAAADGEIARFFDSEAGGITIYQFSRDKRFVYYYAHLQRRAENIQPGQDVKQGTVIGYVGDTGNSGAGNFHLHFSVWLVTDPKRYWEGENINPYPLLVNGLEAR
jgi:peptidoglycan LD-endopeptidase LytH